MVQPINEDLKKAQGFVDKDLLEFEDDEPEGLGAWMIPIEQKARVEHQIACEEQGYPASEAKFSTVAAWEESTGKNWIEHLNF